MLQIFDITVFILLVCQKTTIINEILSYHDTNHKSLEKNLLLLLLLQSLQRHKLLNIYFKGIK